VNALVDATLREVEPFLGYHVGSQIPGNGISTSSSRLKIAASIDAN